MAKQFVITKKIADFGWIDVLVGEKADLPSANVTTLLGKGLGRGYTTEIFHSTEIPLEGGKWSHYTELKAAKRLDQHVSLFARAEFANGNLHGATYLAGIELGW